ncbi:MAG: TlpA disulfide reductase family protein [Bacteroidota bacterium]|nr:TlpA disulfide reductase family protein [Bacteroidota bacterium]
MKNIFKTAIVLAGVLFLSSCGGSKKSNGFELKGTLTNANGETLVLEQMSQTGYVFIDSAKVDEKGNFEFTNVKPTAIDFFRLKTSEANFAVLVADSTQKINFTGDAKNLGKGYTAEGSADTKHFIEINNELLKASAQYDSLQMSMQAAMSSTKMDSVAAMAMNADAEEKFNAIFEKTSAVLVKKVDAFPGTIANFSAFNNINIENNLPLYEKVLSALTEKYPGSFYTQQLKTSISQYKTQFELAAEQDKMLPTGSPMPDIKLKTPEGKEIALSSLKGKLVLVDFWASWCGPCRKENPNVVKLYNQFNKKGFEIYSVSLDEEQDKWEKAIEKDGLKWIHVSDLGGWSSSVCKQFNISSIPFTILVGKDGNIVAKGLRGPELDAKVAEILGK